MSIRRLSVDAQLLSLAHTVGLEEVQRDTSLAGHFAVCGAQCSAGLRDKVRSGNEVSPLRFFYLLLYVRGCDRARADMS